MAPRAARDRVLRGEPDRGWRTGLVTRAVAREPAGVPWGQLGAAAGP